MPIFCVSVGEGRNPSRLKDVVVRFSPGIMSETRSFASCTMQRGMDGLRIRRQRSSSRGRRSGYALNGRQLSAATRTRITNFSD